VKLYLHQQDKFLLANFVDVGVELSLVRRLHQHPCWHDNILNRSGNKIGCWYVNAQKPTLHTNNDEDDRSDRKKFKTLLFL